MSESIAPASGATSDQAADREATEQAARSTRADVQPAEPTAAIGGLDPASRGPLYALLSSLADNKYVLGRRYVEWCTGAPMLESAVAAAAMAQDELGHARSFYPLLRGFPEATEADTREESGWQQRPTSALACLDHGFDGWTDFIAANLLVDAALTALFEAAIDSGYEPLRQRARKIVQEEEGHRVHAERWTCQLAGAERSRAELVASLARMWDDAFTWFGRTDDPVVAQLARTDILTAEPDMLREHLKARLRPTLEAVGLAAALVERQLPWDRWDPTARRLRPAQSAGT